TRHTATPAASNAGWVLSVRLRSSSGPSCEIAHKSAPAPAEASSNVVLTIAYSLANSASMPNACEPWPGKTKARAEGWGLRAVDIRELESNRLLQEKTVFGERTARGIWAHYQ